MRGVLIGVGVVLGATAVAAFIAWATAGVVDVVVWGED